MPRRLIVLVIVAVAVLACVAVVVFVNQSFRNARMCPAGTEFDRTYQNRDLESGTVTGGGVICTTTEGEEVRIPYR